MADEGPAFFDNPAVFDTYMTRRSASGSPNDTIEKPVIMDLLGDVRETSVLDLGCGDARFGVELLGLGARGYLGVEGSERMFAEARKNLTDVRAQLVRDDIQNWSFPTASFDRIVSRLVLHYIEDVSGMFTRIFNALNPGGLLVFSVEHPVITSCDKVWKGEGNRQDWVVDDYFRSGKRVTSWLGSEVIKYHRTIEDYVKVLNESGFRIKALREGRPRASLFDAPGEYERRMRIPLFLIVAAEKPG